MSIIIFALKKLRPLIFFQKSKKKKKSHYCSKSTRHFDLLYMILTSSKSIGEGMNIAKKKKRGKEVYSTDVVDQKLSERSKSH